MKCAPLEKLNDHFQYVILLHFVFENIKYDHLLVGCSQLDRDTLIEQSLLNTHVL